MQIIPKCLNCSDNIKKKLGPLSPVSRPHLGTALIPLVLISVMCVVCTVPLPVHGVRVPLLSDQRRRHVCNVRRDGAKRHAGVDLQPDLPLHLYLAVHLHGAVPLHRAHHRSLRHHYGMVSFSYPLVSLLF